MAACWEQRGCDDIMSATCPHASGGKATKCPLDCLYTYCERPQHEQVFDLDLLLDPTVDRNAAVKEACAMCRHFLTHGPRVA